jgi:ATP-grasp domain
MPDAGAPTRLLLAAACSWESTVPLALALRDAGFDIAIVAPRGHPLHRVPGLMSRLHYWALMPMRSLRQAIEKFAPSIIMPCDEPTMILLQQMRQDPTLAPAIRDAIERALGPEESAPLLTSRTGLAQIAERAGVRIPQSAEIASARQLLAWLKQHGTPAYLKIDRSTGGRGVVRIDSVMSGLLAYFRLRLLFGIPRSLWLWLRWGDLSSLPLLRAEGLAAITIQKAIDGVPANCALSAWRGELIACVAVEALKTCMPNGVATVIRVRDDALMERTAQKVVERLGLSGLHGLDFILARDTGVPWLIEINGRPTQTAYLRLGAGADLAGSLYAAVTGHPLEPVGVFKPQEIITLFDQPSDGRPRLAENRAPVSGPPPSALPLDLPSAANSAVVSHS